MSVNGKLSTSSQCDEVLLDGVLDNLAEIGYTGPLMDDGALQSAIDQGLSSSLYVDLCMFLYLDLKQHCSLQSTVSKPQGPEDLESFQLEVKSLLQEMHCPHSVISKEGLDILSSYHKRLLLLDYLLSEVLTARLVSVRSRDEPMDVQGSSVPANLSAILKVYEITSPPPTVTVRQILERIIGKTHEMVSKAPEDHISLGLVTQPLTSEQLTALDRINEALTEEYAVRRKMLLTRCDVTVQSFRWSDRIKGKEDEFSQAYQSRRQSLLPSAPVSISRVFAAKQDMLTIEKTNSGSVRSRTQCSINKVLIGKVPDRGGRPTEARRPPEMPAFKGRTVDPRDQRKGGGRGGHGKGRGGGRVQGGWSGGQGGHKGGGWHQGGGAGGHGQHSAGQQKQYYS